VCVLLGILKNNGQSLLFPYAVIKTHGSESRGQERAKRSPKTKHATNYCVSFTRANVIVI